MTRISSSVGENNNQLFKLNLNYIPSFKNSNNKLCPLLVWSFILIDVSVKFVYQIWCFTLILLGTLKHCFRKVISFVIRNTDFIVNERIKIKLASERY